MVAHGGYVLARDGRAGVGRSLGLFVEFFLLMY